MLDEAYQQIESPADSPKSSIKHNKFGFPQTQVKSPQNRTQKRERQRAEDTFGLLFDKKRKVISENGR